ncbi:AaceriAGR317Cp [[Ashbya] aceris (nom. inval.)]|nr:AaceriAGR317Cp [[Ashbya] aceris (nom. inval.)]
MKVEAVRDAFISDYEALQFMSHLQRRHQWVVDDDVEMADDRRRKKKQYNHPELQAITKDVVNYLSANKNADPEEEQEPVKSGITRMNDEKFTTLMQTLNQFDLYKAEKLQLVNQLPLNIVHLYALVEECDSRFSEEQVSAIIDAITTACL